MLAAIGLDEHALECGAHAPTSPPAAAELLRKARAPSQLHNNCSGKHTGFLAVCRHRGIPHRRYVEAHHPLQAEVRDGARRRDGRRARRGALRHRRLLHPHLRVPLTALARGFARFGTGVGLSRARAAAAQRIYEAAVSEPFYVAGTDRFCTDVMTLLKGAALSRPGRRACSAARCGPRARRGAEMRRRRHRAAEA